jgi:hypothetical protein
LLDAGVTRMLTAEGWIDFENDTDRVLHAVKQDLGRNAFSRSLSANISRACLSRAREGKWNGGRVPYGYVVGNDHRLELGDPLEVEAVRLIFELIAAGLTCHRVVRELERREVPHPKYGSQRWTRNTVYGIVTNRKYTGAMVYGQLHQGKYSECSAEGVRNRRRSPKTASGHLRQVEAPPEDVIVVEGAHPPIVDADLWERAQRGLTNNRWEPKSGVRQKRRSHKWPLSGLAYCQNCGKRMYGTAVLVDRTRRLTVRRYACSSYHLYGKDVCSNNHLDEQVLMPLVFEAVRNALSNPEGIRRVRSAVEREVMRGHKSSTTRVQALRKQADELDVKARQGTEKLAVLPVDLVDDVARLVREWKEKRDHLLAEAAQLEEADARIVDGERRVEEAMKVFEELGEWMAGPESDAVPSDLKAEALTALVDRLELRFETRDRGKRRESRCVEVNVHFREATGLLNRLRVDVQRRFPMANR